MKSITKKYLCLMLGFILFHGVAWGMDKKPFRFSNPDLIERLCEKNLSDGNLDFIEKLCENYKKDLYTGKIRNYTKEIAGYNCAERCIKRCDNLEFRNNIYCCLCKNLWCYLKSSYPTVCDDLKFFAGMERILTGKKWCADLSNLPRGKGSFFADMAIFFKENNFDSKCSYKIFNDFILGASLTLLKAIHKEKFPEEIKYDNVLFAQFFSLSIYGSFLWPGNICDPLKEYEGIKTILPMYKERLKYLIDGIDTIGGIEYLNISDLCRVCSIKEYLEDSINKLIGIKEMLEKYLKIEKIVKEQLKHLEDSKVLMQNNREYADVFIFVY